MEIVKFGDIFFCVNCVLVDSEGLEKNSHKLNNHIIIHI